MTSYATVSDTESPNTYYLPDQPNPEDEVEIIKCESCNIFWGWPYWNNLCSHCGNPDIEITINRFKYEDGFKDRLNAWAENKMAPSTWNRILKRAANMYNGNINELGPLMESLTELKNNDMYLSAAEAKIILRQYGKDDMTKSHIVCPFIIDWWNMTDGFTNAELCYYTKPTSTDEYFITTIPPDYLNKREFVFYK